MKEKQFVCKPGGTGYTELHKFLVDNESKVMTYTPTEGVPKKRSLDSNALQAVWIREISEWSGEDKEHVRGVIKRDYGVDVICYNVETEEETKRAERILWTLNKIGYFTMTPKQQLIVLEQFAVTSIMTRRQHKVMLDDVVNFYANHGLILVSNKG